MTCQIGTCASPALPDSPFCGDCFRAIHFGDDHVFGDYDA